MRNKLGSVAILVGLTGLLVCAVATYVWAENQPRQQDQTSVPLSAAESRQLAEYRESFITDQFIVLDPQTRSAQPTATLGVHVRNADATLRHHLGLNDGVGLVVELVSPESAASESGLQRHDVLKKMDEQILINDQQLQALIQIHQPGDEVRLTIVRAGKTENIRAKLKEGVGTSKVELFKDYKEYADAYTQLAKAHHNFDDPSIANCSNCHMTHDAYRRN